MTKAHQEDPSRLYDATVTSSVVWGLMGLLLIKSSYFMFVQFALFFLLQCKSQHFTIFLRSQIILKFLHHLYHQ